MTLRFKPFLAFVFALPLVGFASGCDNDCDLDCSCIKPAIDVNIVDTITQQPVDAMVMSSPTSCNRVQAGMFTCDAPAGTTNTITVSAPGYASKTITVNVPAIDPDACCPCGTYLNEKVDLVAMP